MPDRAGKKSGTRSETAPAGVTHDPSAEGNLGLPLSNPDRPPAGAIGNGVNMGWFALFTVWINAQIACWIPISIDPALGLPVEGSLEAQQLLALGITGVVGVLIGFGSNVLKNISAGKEGTFAQRIGAKLAARLP